MTSSNEFETSVKRYMEGLKEKEVKNTVDWNERKEWWQTKVMNLFHQINEWLQPLIDSGTIQLHITSAKLSEEMLGVYEVQVAAIKLGPEILDFKPVGSVIIGGYGRVDVEGPKGSVLLILSSDVTEGTAIARRSSAAWHIASPRDRENIQLLTKESFQQLFSDLFGIE